MSSGGRTPAPGFHGWPVGLAGESYYQAAIARCEEGESVTLVPEPDNSHDARAIKVLSEAGKQIGYIPRGSWVTGALLDEGDQLRAIIHAIEGKRPKRGVVLDVFHADAGGAAASGKPRAAAPTSQLGGCGWTGIAALAVLVVIWFLK